MRLTGFIWFIKINNSYWDLSFVILFLVLYFFDVDHCVELLGELVQELILLVLDLLATSLTM